MRDLPESLLAQQYGTPEVGGLTAAQSTVAEIVNLGRRAIAIQADVSKKRDTQYMVEETGRQLGDLHILVCNAGVVSHSTVEAMTEDAWDLTFAVNVKGVFLSRQAAIPVMKARGSGCIISTASVAGKNGFPGLAHYCASKFAIVGFSWRWQVPSRGNSAFGSMRSAQGFSARRCGNTWQIR